MPRWWMGLLLLTLLIPSGAGAVQSSALGAYPTGTLGSHTPWFQYQLAPGQAVTGSVTVDNRLATSQDVLLYPVDASPNGDGGFGMMPQSARATDTGSWIQLSKTTLDLPPLSQQLVSFHLVVPAHTSVGPHYAGIIIQPAPPHNPTISGASIKVISRLGVRLYLTVPGRIHPGLTIGTLDTTPDHHHLTLATTLRNTGNTLLTPTGELKLSSPLRRTVSLPFNAGRSLQPSQQIHVLLPSALAINSFPRRYTAKLQLHYGESPHQGVVTRTVTFWTGNLVAWTIGLAVVLLVAVVMAMKYCRYRHRQRHRRNQRQA